LRFAIYPGTVLVTRNLPVVRQPVLEFLATVLESCNNQNAVFISLFTAHIAEFLNRAAGLAVLEFSRDKRGLQTTFKAHLKALCLSQFSPAAKTGANQSEAWCLRPRHYMFLYHKI